MSGSELAEKLHGRRSGRGWIAKCPAHPDRAPSLSIRQGDAGRVLVHCFAGCTTASVLAALGLRWDDILPPRRKLSPAEMLRQRFTRERAEVAAWKIHDSMVRLRGHYADALRRAERLCARMGERIMRATSDAEIENGWDALVRLGPALTFFLAAFNFSWDATPDAIARFVLASPSERRAMVLGGYTDVEIAA
jgi:hypothetical protein